MRYQHVQANEDVLKRQGNFTTLRRDTRWSVVTTPDIEYQVFCLEASLDFSLKCQKLDSKISGNC